MTQACNLKCVHCYAQAKAAGGPDELTTEEGKALIDDLTDFGSPVILFSGGEPLMRPDLTELIRHAVSRGMRAVISTNGTLITPEKAGRTQRPGAQLRGHQPGRAGRSQRPVPRRQGGF